MSHLPSELAGIVAQGQDLKYVNPKSNITPRHLKYNKTDPAEDDKVGENRFDIEKHLKFRDL